ncbi:MAG: Fe(2+)-trafficking protein [Gemmataceae bacterium]|nr:Fe(2+)-trafficking protein [Gemmataceae bacterium]MDW8264450.1 Fe(2+)-trafficking protein [Gemmataceae bacterium]
MSALDERIAQFRKMAQDDPDNELGHFRLGQLLMEAGQLDEAVQSFRRTLELSPQFSKVYQLLGRCLIQLNQKEEAIRVLQEGWKIADARGDHLPRGEMARMLLELGAAVPESKKADPAVGSGGFRCQRPGCFVGSRARQLPAPPMKDDLGQLIYQTICADCWNLWLRDYSVKVINELRLDLSTEFGQEEYDKYMRGFFGLE